MSSGAKFAPPGCMAPEDDVDDAPSAGRPCGISRAPHPDTGVERS
jgi:hypothetical protein